MADGGLNRVVRHLLQAARGREGGNLTDSQLLECFVSDRDELAFEALVYRHGPMVLGVCRRLLGHVQDAEDAFQATFMVLLRKGSTVWPRAKVGNWLYGVAYRIALKARAGLRKRQSREKPLPTALTDQAAPHEPGLDWLPLLDRELHGLPAKYRMAIVLCDLQGKSQHDAARQLGWREGTLSGRLSRARVLLAKRLSRRGFTLSLTALTAALSSEGASAKVPAAMAAATTKALQFTAFKQAVAAGVISAPAAALTEGVLKTMMWTKIKAFVICTAAVVVVTTGLGRAIFTASGQTSGPGGGPANTQPANTQRAVKNEGLSRQAKDLDNKLQAAGDWDFEDRPLGEVLNVLRSKHRINIVLDQNAVTSDDGAATTPPADLKVSVQLNQVPLETALRYLLKSVNLGFVNRDGVLVVTSREKTMVRKVYPVGTLLGKDEDQNAQALIQVIVNTIAPETWSFVSRKAPNVFNQNVFNPFQAGAAQPNGFNMMGGGGMFGNVGGVAGGQFGMMGAAPQPPPLAEGGPLHADGKGGSIVYFPGTKTLVVRQFFETHREIEDLLKQLAEK